MSRIGSPRLEPRITFALGSVVLAGGIAAYSTHRGWVRWSDPSNTEYPVWGIGVSHHQQAIEW